MRLPSSLEHRRRRRQHVLLAPPRPHDDLPDQQGEGDGCELRPGRQPQLASAIRPGAASGVRRRDGGAVVENADRRAGIDRRRVAINCEHGPHLLAQLVGDRRRPASRPPVSRCAAAARCRRRSSTRRGRGAATGRRSGRRGGPPRARCGSRRATVSSAGRGRGFELVVEQCRGSSRRARRTARPSAARRRPGPAHAPARRAGACRPRARAVASWRRSSRCTDSSSCVARCRRSALRTPPSFSGSSTFVCDRQPGEQRRLLEHQGGATHRRRPCRTTARRARRRG